jgi:hypothetical protein
MIQKALRAREAMFPDVEVVMVPGSRSSCATAELPAKVHGPPLSRNVEAAASWGRRRPFRKRRRENGDA